MVAWRRDLHAHPELGNRECRTAAAIMYRSGGFLAASDGLRIVVKGRQTHAAMPWAGTDPIVVAAQIVLGLQTIVSRHSDLTTAP